jgi:hypothetical protein
LYLGTNIEALFSLIGSKIHAGPRSLIVTHFPQDWALYFASKDHKGSALSKNSVQNLWRMNQTRVIDPTQIFNYLQNGRNFSQIVVDAIPARLFDKSAIDATLAILRRLSSLTTADLVLSILASDEDIMRTIEDNLRSERPGEKDLIACWLVGRGNSPVRYLKLTQTRTPLDSPPLIASCKDSLLPLVSRKESGITNPFIEVTHT